MYCVSALPGKASLVLLREFDQKPGDLTIADQQQVDDLLAKADVERILKKMANQLTAEERLRILMSLCLCLRQITLIQESRNKEVLFHQYNYKITNESKFNPKH